MTLLGLMSGEDPAHLAENSLLHHFAYFTHLDPNLHDGRVVVWLARQFIQTRGYRL